MPVVTIYFDRIYSMLKGEIDRDELLDKIPYLGLDIEEIHESYFKLEYNPNRPDFSTDYGLARALNAFLEFEKSWSDYKITKNDLTIHVDQSIKNVRPYITSEIIKNMPKLEWIHFGSVGVNRANTEDCLLYTSDAADE